MKKNKLAIIYGTGSIAEVAWYYLQNDSLYEVVGFVSDELPSKSTFCNLPVVHSSEITNVFSEGEHEAFVAIGYSKMNSVREKCMDFLKRKNFKLLNYVSSNAFICTNLGLEDRENVFILENNVIQPFVTIGNGVFMWSGNHIGHHSNIRDYCFISSHVVISGHCTVNEYAFLGVNSTIVEGVSIGEKNIVGAGTFIKRDTAPGSVYYINESSKSSKDSSFFLK
jgi:sugar O-acyltransferase (sialic acid O-acetyltransferase NeuD family)